MQGVSGEGGVPHDDVLCIALCGALVDKVDDELSQDVGFATCTPVRPWPYYNDHTLTWEVCYGHTSNPTDYSEHEQEAVHCERMNTAVGYTNCYRQA